MLTEESEAAAICHAMLSKMQTVKDLYTPKGNCKGCGECCARFLPVSKFDTQRLSDYVCKHHIKPHKATAALDLTCPYLTDAKECAVYPARPEVCRTYRCDKQVRGESLDFFGSGAANVVDMREWATVMAMPNDELCELADRIAEQMED